jgi:TMEM199 family protein
LERRAEQQAYQRLLSSHKEYNNGIESEPNPEDDENGDDSLTPSLVINIFLSILLTGFSTYWVLRNFQTPDFLSFNRNNKGKNQPSYPGNPSPSKDAVFVLISIATGIVVGVAEVVVYASYLRKVREAKRKEKNKKEKKVLIQSSLGDDEHNGGMKERSPLDRKDEETQQDKEEIWGKGINGGVRRRVKERWEKEKIQQHG